MTGHEHRWTRWLGREEGGRSGMMNLGCVCGATFRLPADAEEARAPGACTITEAPAVAAGERIEDLSAHFAEATRLRVTAP